MTYQNDPLLPILEGEIKAQTTAYQTLTAKEESDLLSLKDEQKRLLVDSDKSAKAEYLKQQPNIADAGVKMQEKYKSYIATLH